MEKAWCDNCKKLIEDDEIQLHMIAGHSILLGFTNKESERTFLQEVQNLSTSMRKKNE